MRKGLVVALGLVLVVAVLVAGCASDGDASTGTGVLSGESQGLRWSPDVLQQAGIWVTGTGEVSVVPDVAILSLGVEAQAPTVGEAQERAASAMTDVMSALVANGVAEKDIQTQRFSISPVTRWDEDSDQVVTVGYRVANTVTAKIRNVDDTGTVIDAVAETAGDLTRINGVSFTVDDPEPYYDEAREEAILEAMAKAEQIASVAGVGLGGATFISESGGSMPPVPYPVARFDVAESGAGFITPISVGETEITLTVQMGFALE